MFPRHDTNHLGCRDPKHPPPFLMNVIYFSFLTTWNILKKNHFPRTQYYRRPPPPLLKRIFCSAVTGSFRKHKSTNRSLEEEYSEANCQENFEEYKGDGKKKKCIVDYFELVGNSRMASYNVSYSVICCDVFILAEVNVIRCRYVLGKMPDEDVERLRVFVSLFLELTTLNIRDKACNLVS